MLNVKPRSQVSLCSFVICLLMLLGIQTFAEGVPDDCTQLMLGIAPTWDSMRGELRLFERPRGGEWKVTAGPFPVLFGKNGLAWGTGILGQNEPGLRKKERDGRAPAGIFAIGQVFGYDAHLPAGADYPYHQVTDADIWSDDPRSPNYNRHIVIDPKNPPDNSTHEKMRSGDFAYHWLVEIRHNSAPPVPRAGSARFFSIRCGVNSAPPRCTSPAAPSLLHLAESRRSERKSIRSARRDVAEPKDGELYSAERERNKPASAPRGRQRAYRVVITPRRARVRLASPPSVPVSKPPVARRSNRQLLDR